MRVIINDANILIDLVKLDLLDIFTQLDVELYTTDFVLEELNENQKKEVLKFVTDLKITVIETVNETDLLGISSLLEQNNGLSFEDCSVWYYSTKLSGILLTGDGKLRKQAQNSGVTVKGILYIFDELVQQSLLSYSSAIEKMELLCQLNNRLPQTEIEHRIKHWNEKNNKT